MFHGSLEDPLSILQTLPYLLCFLHFSWLETHFPCLYLCNLAELYLVLFPIVSHVLSILASIAKMNLFLRLGLELCSAWPEIWTPSQLPKGWDYRCALYTSRSNKHFWVNVLIKNKISFLCSYNRESTQTMDFPVLPRTTGRNKPMFDWKFNQYKQGKNHSYTSHVLTFTFLVKHQ